MEKSGRDSYLVLLEGGEGVYEEKRSRFLATVRRCDSEDMAAAFLEEMRKKYWDARHHCSAFVIGSRGELTRCSDDGEPAGTAGRPMLEVLTGSGVRNVAVVVSRYFGGVLLGTGGLVRAYTQAVKAGLANSRIGRMRPGWEVELTTDYNGIGRVLYVLRSRGLGPVSAEYGERVELKVLAPAEELEVLQKELTEATSGRLAFGGKRELYYVEE